ncbi:hypothetical protein P171DRAFT_468522 [Karstenula rhodostoma CBS 690.94]|uniref:Uncharacterized protein n=1 Tax=Karstenula rhodostoma CBS 690.94 TaxID=1392251 RepID=A0A9P4UJH1_9PLEO|nr:hypothetical protein P171DRAFT_468522 [Karstenula rhodostoma CBS 690.94]
MNTNDASSRTCGNLHVGARFLFKMKPAEALKDTRVETQQTGQMIRRKTWAPNSHMSSHSLGSMVTSGISEDTKKLLEGAIEEFREFKREEEQKRIREEENRKSWRRLKRLWRLSNSGDWTFFGPFGDLRVHHGTAAWIPASLTPAFCTTISALKEEMLLGRRPQQLRKIMISYMLAAFPSILWLQRAI